MTTTTQPDATTADQAYEIGTLYHVPPTELLLERNIREATPSKDLTASIKAVGLQQPIVAVTTPEGRLLVRTGHRRTMAAVDLALDTVPVYVADADSLEKTSEVHRVLAQRDENTHRLGLSAVDELHVVEQLHLFGLSAAQIAKQGRIARTQVDTAMSINQSDLARRAAQKYADLTIDQAAAVAEFDDEPEIAKELLVAALKTPSQFPHIAQRKRDQRAEDLAIAAFKAEHEAAGRTVVARPEHGALTRSVGALIDVKTRQDLDPAAHLSCPGAVVWMGYDWTDVDKNGVPVPGERRDLIEETLDAEYARLEDLPEDTAETISPEAAAMEAERDSWRNQRVPIAIHGCNDPMKHGHVDQYARVASSTPAPTGDPEADAAAAAAAAAEVEKAKQDRRLVIENNKAWASAETVRREWLVQFATRKTPSKGTAAFLAAALDQHGLPGGVDYSRHSNAKTLAAEWLGCKGSELAGLATADGVTENRALQIAVVILVARYETALGKDDWRSNGLGSDAGRYLRYLQAAGYGLSDVEKYAISKRTV